MPFATGKKKSLRRFHDVNNISHVVAGPRGFEPLVFGFLPLMRPEADALIRAGLRAPFSKR